MYGIINLYIKYLGDGVIEYVQYISYVFFKYINLNKFFLVKIKKNNVLIVIMECVRLIDLNISKCIIVYVI